MDIKQQIIEILTPIFGPEVNKIISEHYDNTNSEELIDLARHMLTSYMGEKNASKILARLIKNNEA